MKRIILLILVVLSYTAIGQQAIPDKVAQYSAGERGTENFELFAFYTKKGSYHAKVEYSYGKDEKRLLLHYIGIAKTQGKDAFKVKFANNYTLDITPQKDFSLKIEDKKGKYSKIFKWQYEGPIDGRGTFCSVCADDEKAAMQIIDKYYLKKK